MLGQSAARCQGEPAAKKHFTKGNAIGIVNASSRGGRTCGGQDRARETERGEDRARNGLIAWADALDAAAGVGSACRCRPQEPASVPGQDLVLRRTGRVAQGGESAQAD